MSRIYVTRAHGCKGSPVLSCWRPESFLTLPKATQLIKTVGVCAESETQKRHMVFFFGGVVVPSV